jgi:hypothetical protein
MESRLSRDPTETEIDEYGATCLPKRDFAALLVDWIKLSREELRSRVLTKRLITVVEDYCHQRGHVIRFKPLKSARKSASQH